MKEPLQVYAAGSLREALTEIARDHEARTGQTIALTFGASGLLRERIEKAKARRCSPRPTPSTRSAWPPPVAGQRPPCSCATACARSRRPV